MKKLTKILVFLIISTMLLSTLTACSSPSKTPSDVSSSPSSSPGNETSSKGNTSDPVVLKLWGGVPEERGPSDVAAKFNEEFKDKGISVVYERYVNDESGNLKLNTALLSGEDVDLYFSYSVPAYVKRVESGMATNLSSFIQRDGFSMEENFGTMASAYYVDGEPYCMPTYAYKYCFLINKDMFDEAGIPVPTNWSLDEFREICRKLTTGSGSNKRYGAFISTDSQMYFPALIVGTKLGGDYFFKDAAGKESAFDDPTYKNVLTTFADMMLVDGSLVPHADIITEKLSAINLFVQEKAAIIDAYWSVRDLRDLEKYPHDFKVAFVPMPTAEKMTREESYISGGFMDYLSINSKSKNQEAAWEFIKWYTTEGILPMVPHGCIPASAAIDQNIVAESFAAGVEELFDMESFKNELLTSEKKYQLSSITEKLSEVTQIAKEEFELVYVGSKKPEEALASAKERADAILGK